ncbi:hypothetical protein GJ629_04410 [Halapricum sp. CBA1109]|uniref:DUF7289 family protein n=1 Tax=Halapricum sp. CBA1109 TaxID=2668068 RepID=UPI0012F776AB|nr:hypothetical protein [Halapricum sp. CBA1109]MUV89233.1 hypothetical protein [Halapricum sp. CBA1109]
MDGTRRPRTVAVGDRGLSDTLGFVLTFSIVIGSVGLVSIIGLGQLEDFSTDQQLRNAETTFELIARSFDEIEEGQTETRTDALELDGGQMYVEQSSSATVTVDHPGSDYEATVPLNALVYRTDDTEVVYENGATFRGAEDWESGVLNHDPGLVCRDRGAVISLVTLDAIEGRTYGGDSTLRVTGRSTNTTLLYPTADSGPGSADSATDVAVEIDSPRAAQWRQYFEDTAFDTDDSGPTTTVSCEGTERVYVRHTVIDVTFDS